MPNHIEHAGTSFSAVAGLLGLVAYAIEFDYNVELLQAAEVSDVHRTSVKTSTGDSYGADALIVATGSRYRRFGVPGEDGLIGPGVHYCATRDGRFYRGAKELVVVGGGNSALEEADFLTTIADKVTILTRGDLRASELVQARVRSDPGIEIHTGMDILDFEPAAAFVCVDLDPNTSSCAGPSTWTTAVSS